MRALVAVLLVLGASCLPADAAPGPGLAAVYVAKSGQDGNVGPCTVTIAFARLPDAANWQMVVTNTASGCVPALPNGGVGTVTLDGATGSVEQGFVSWSGRIVVDPPSEYAVDGAQLLGKAHAAWDGRDFTMTFAAV